MVASVVASWMVVIGRVVDVSGFISSEVDAQEIKKKETTNTPNDCFILFNQLTLKVQFY